MLLLYVWGGKVNMLPRGTDWDGVLLMETLLLQSSCAAYGDPALATIQVTAAEKLYPELQ